MNIKRSGSAVQISVALAASLLAMTAMADAGDYALVATNACGSAITESALLMVQTAPIIETDPTGDAVEEANDLFLRVGKGVFELFPVDFDRLALHRGLASHPVELNPVRATIATGL